MMNTLIPTNQKPSFKLGVAAMEIVAVTKMFTECLRLQQKSQTFKKCLDL